MYQNVGDVLGRVQDTVPYLGIELRDIDQRSMFGDTPLILVMSWSDVPAATLLIEGGADLGAKGENGETALHRAVLFRDIDLVALLIANDAPKAIVNDNGNTPLDLAKLDGNEAIARLLNSRS